MSESSSYLLVASALALAACIVHRFVARGETRRLGTAVILGVTLAVVVTIAPGRTGTRGELDEIVSVAVCYACMLLGMMAEYGYVQAEKGRRRFRFDLMTFLMPVFASPIVFIPLLTLTTDQALSGGAFTRARLMVYLVAFQNGFFWKSFFEQRRLAPGQGVRTTA